MILITPTISTVQTAGNLNSAKENKNILGLFALWIYILKRKPYPVQLEKGVGFGYLASRCVLLLLGWWSWTSSNNS